MLTTMKPIAKSGVTSPRAASIMPTMLKSTATTTFPVSVR